MIGRSQRRGKASLNRLSSIGRSPALERLPKPKRRHVRGQGPRMTPGHACMARTSGGEDVADAYEMPLECEQGE